MAQCCKTQHALSCREALQALIPAMLGAQGAEEEGDDSLLQGITRGTFQGIMQDRLSSHVMEVCTPLSLCALHAPPPPPGAPSPPRRNPSMPCDLVQLDLNC